MILITQKKLKASGGNFLVEFNNKKEVKRNIEQVKVEYNNSKEVIVQNKVIKEESIQESLPKKEIMVNEQQIITQVNEPIIYQNENINENIPNDFKRIDKILFYSQCKYILIRKNFLYKFLINIKF